ncbi:hypothetical protein [Candidatus Burkholderia verschuerenii]|uniref:hypothetical protein n=1 Tax=Candidatus Burkholderia verschuerenii TaxID=242163 RepID=UPI0012EEDAFA|nr:hypothetical protein [Candidatus Burkholderia verschuerenii]
MKRSFDRRARNRFSENGLETGSKNRRIDKPRKPPGKADAKHRHGAARLVAAENSAPLYAPRAGQSF